MSEWSHPDEDKLEATFVNCPDQDNCEPYGLHWERASRGRCIRCGNYPMICGHSLSFKEKIKTVNADTGWMPTAGSSVQRPFGGE